MGKGDKFKLKKFFADFKAFITRGNILDMAVGVIIGGAFSAVVTSFTNKILMPIINAVLSYITNGAGLYTILFHSEKATAEQIAAGTAITGPDGQAYSRIFYIDWSNFIDAVINFFFIALTLFIILKTVMYISKKNAELKAKAKEKIEAKRARGEEVTPEEEAQAEPEVKEEPKPDPVILLLQEIRDELKAKDKKDE